MSLKFIVCGMYTKAYIVVEGRDYYAGSFWSFMQVGVFPSFF